MTPLYGTRIHHNKHYEVIVAEVPACAQSAAMPAYGIRNKGTGVIEGYIGQYAKAIWFADQYAMEIEDGYGAEVNDLAAALKAASKLKTGGGSAPLNS